MGEAKRRRGHPADCSCELCVAHRGIKSPGRRGLNMAERVRAWQRKQAQTNNSQTPSGGQVP